jgi:hypothetical protein
MRQGRDIAPPLAQRADTVVRQTNVLRFLTPTNSRVSQDWYQ